ncbi:hypothetical protein [Ancylobacter mangrovi]|uniref:hypothetical protein n=1 Tax=Ancylobacter mangrovi TaxID=2972472 RepID=UPI002162789F|nr:hypothetical protein [Ancylobacter mangrovi]MCS0501028.1 hypothetical protein [Ancylobacter mangrovi]
MKTAAFVLALGFAGGIAAARPALAAGAGFECPTPSEPGAKPTIADVQKLLPSGDSMDDPAKLNAAIGTLRQDGAKAPYIIDHLIAAYCPTVAQDGALDAEARTAKMRRFAAQITSLVYQLGDTTRIIVSVPLPPELLQSAQAAAAKAKVPLDAWIAQSMTSSLSE